MMSRTMIFWIVLTVFCSLGSGLGDTHVMDNATVKGFKGNILCLTPIPSRSHHIWNRSIMVSLANKGYNVTALSVDVDDEVTPNLHYIHMEGAYDIFRKLLREEGPNSMIHSSVFETIRQLGMFLTVISNITSQTNGYQQLLAYPDDFKFDLVIMEYTGIPDILGFLHKFNYPPLVGITSFLIPPNTYEVMGSPIFPSLIPYYETHFSTDMSFWQRSLNLFYFTADSYYRRKYVAAANAIAKRVFGEDLPPIEDLVKKIDLALVNSHPSMDIPGTLLPNVIAVGGLHIKEPKPVSESINKFFESAKKGAIYFSLGTNVHSSMVGEERIQMFVRTFSKFPDYHFLWKTDRNDLNVSKNVMVTEWASQNGILAHPKIKLFMTHCGLLSTQETTWHGVPMLAIPFFADQHTNAKRSVEAGVAEKLMISKLTEDEIVMALRRMLENSSYQTAMSLRSRRFRDRPRPPLQEAVWWCEYVLRHRGAPHLRSAAAIMTPLALYMWDLLIVWSAAVLASLTALSCLLKRLLCGQTNYTKSADALRAKKTR